MASGGYLSLVGVVGNIFWKKGVGGHYFQLLEAVVAGFMTKGGGDCQ